MSDAVIFMLTNTELAQAITDTHKLIAGTCAPSSVHFDLCSHLNALLASQAKRANMAQFTPSPEWIDKC